MAFVSFKHHLGYQKYNSISFPTLAFAPCLNFADFNRKMLKKETYPNRRGFLIRSDSIERRPVRNDSNISLSISRLMLFSVHPGF